MGKGVKASRSPIACVVAESKTEAWTTPLRATIGIAGVTTGTGAKAGAATTRDSISLQGLISEETLVRTL